MVSPSPRGGDAGAVGPGSYNSHTNDTIQSSVSPRKGARLGTPKSQSRINRKPQSSHISGRISPPSSSFGTGPRTSPTSNHYLKSGVLFSSSTTAPSAVGPGSYSTHNEASTPTAPRGIVRPSFNKRIVDGNHPNTMSSSPLKSPLRSPQRSPLKSPQSFIRTSRNPRSPVRENKPYNPYETPLMRPHSRDLYSATMRGLATT